MTLEALKVVKEPVFGVVEPIELGAANVEPLSKLAFKLGIFVELDTVSGAVPVATVEINWVPWTLEVAVRVVKAPLADVPLPIGPGAAKVAPLRELAFKFGIFVELATTKGGLPVATVLVIAPVALKVVKAPEPAVVEPIDPGEAKVAPLRKLAFKLGTTVVDATTKGGLPVTMVLVIAPEALTDVKSPVFGVVAPIEPVMSPVVLKVVKVPEPAVVEPIEPGEANVAPPSKLAFKLGTMVVLVTVKGAVPVAIVEMSLVPWIVEEAVRVVKAPDPAVVEPMEPGAANVAPPRKLTFKLGTTVVEVTVRGAVPVAIVEIRRVP